MYTLSQLLFYNAKLMYRSIIVMDFLGFSIFDKKYKKKKSKCSHIRIHISLFDN